MVCGEDQRSKRNTGEMLLGYPVYEVDVATPLPASVCGVCLDGPGVLVTEIRKDLINSMKGKRDE